mmetsp:Transcript_29709/g.76800  ORF Transcript_29709/g.76800 Transcript_29709/m.76800 type:complete len:269 (+) Transcript_29709:1084-1890(+)
MLLAACSEHPWKSIASPRRYASMGSDDCAGSHASVGCEARTKRRMHGRFSTLTRWDTRSLPPPETAAAAGAAACRLSNSPRTAASVWYGPASCAHSGSCNETPEVEVAAWRRRPLASMARRRRQQQQPTAAHTRAAAAEARAISHVKSSPLLSGGGIAGDGGGDGGGGTGGGGDGGGGATMMVRGTPTRCTGASTASTGTPMAASRAVRSWARASAAATTAVRASSPLRSVPVSSKERRTLTNAEAAARLSSRAHTGATHARRSRRLS